MTKYTTFWAYIFYIASLNIKYCKYYFNIKQYIIFYILYIYKKLDKGEYHGWTSDRKTTIQTGAMVKIPGRRFNQYLP